MVLVVVVLRMADVIVEVIARSYLNDNIESGGEQHKSRQL